MPLPCTNRYDMLSFALENILGCLEGTDLKNASWVNKQFYENAYAVLCKKTSAPIQKILHRTFHISNFVGVEARRFYGAISQGTIHLTIKEITNMYILGNLRCISPRNISIPYATSNLSKIDIENLFKFFPYLSHLSLTNSSTSPTNLRDLLPNLNNSNLTSLSLKGFELSERICSQLPIGLTKLELINCLLGQRELHLLSSYKIQSLNLKKSNISQNMLTEVEKMKSLQCLNLEENYEIDFSTLIQFLKKRPLKRIAYGNSGDIEIFFKLRKLFPDLILFQTKVLRRRYSI